MLFGGCVCSARHGDCRCTSTVRAGRARQAPRWCARRSRACHGRDRARRTHGRGYAPSDRGVLWVTQHPCRMPRIARPAAFVAAANDPAFHFRLDAGMADCRKATAIALPRMRARRMMRLNVVADCRRNDQTALGAEGAQADARAAGDLECAPIGPWSRSDPRLPVRPRSNSRIRSNRQAVHAASNLNSAIRSPIRACSSASSVLNN